MEYQEEPFETSFGSFKVAPRVPHGDSSALGWYLSGPEGVISFSTLTLAPPVRTRLGAEIDGRKWLAMWFGYHSPHPMYGDHTVQDCTALDDGKCYMGWDNGLAVALLRKWAESGCDDVVIWRWLSKYYKRVFLTGNKKEGT